MLFLQVFQQVVKVQFLPVFLGWLIQKFSPKIASVIGKPLILIAIAVCKLVKYTFPSQFFEQAMPSVLNKPEHRYNLLFLLLLILLLLSGFRLMRQIGILPLVVIALVVVISLAIGHFLGGSEVEKRSALAIACIARNWSLD